MVEFRPSKPAVRVRSPSPAPILIVGNLVKMFVKLQGVKVC